MPGAYGRDRFPEKERPVERARLVVNAPAVISEVMDGEAVIMNLASGRYFSCQDVGGEIWSLIQKGITPEQIMRFLASRYEGDREIIEVGLAEFISALKDHDLVRLEPVDGETSEALEPDPLTEAAAGQQYRPPELNVYSDMEDLLLLDPIHDVDETGWPMPKMEGSA